MPVAKADKEFVSYLLELMQSIGPVTARRMFGGHGIFLDGLMFGLVSGGELYLKTDKESEGEFVDKGLQPFVYCKKGKPFKIAYYQAPAEALEDRAEMNLWGNKAYASALKAAALKKT